MHVVIISNQTVWIIIRYLTRPVPVPFLHEVPYAHAHVEFRASGSTHLEHSYNYMCTNFLQAKAMPIISLVIYTKLYIIHHYYCTTQQHTPQHCLMSGILHIHQQSSSCLVMD